jgi:hypothetical protein
MAAPNRFAKRPSQTLGDSGKHVLEKSAVKGDTDFMDFKVVDSKVPSHTMAPPAVDDRSKRQKLNSLMEGSLDEGMKRPIDETNVGFKLLAKLGYKASSGGLGKYESGRVDPISINTDTGLRVGVGRVRQEEERMEAIVEKQKDRAANVERLGNQFQNRVKMEQQYQQLRKYKHQCEKLIYDFDSRNNVDCHDLWPDSEREIERPIGDDDFITYDESSLSLPSVMKYVSYLRDNYSYCPFCGHSYESSDDLTVNCPGISWEDH